MLESSLSALAAAAASSSTTTAPPAILSVTSAALFNALTAAATITHKTNNVAAAAVAGENATTHNSESPSILLDVNSGAVAANAVTEVDTIDYVPPWQRPETYIVSVLFSLIFIIGVLGNGTLVIIFFRHRSMRNIPNTYILSLALADLLVIITCVPLACIVYTQESWTFGRELCRVSESFKDISIGVSVFTLTALSGERYCAIVNPLRKLQTKPLTVFTASIIWLLAILLSTPSIVVSDLQEIHIPNTNLTIIICSPFGPNRTNYESYARYTVVSKAFIYYLLPLSIIGALYILMAKRLHTSAREMPGEALGMQTRSQARARRHVARMVVAFVVVFFVCFFPYHVFELWFHLNPTAKEDFDEFWHAIRIIGFCASFLHSCTNPVALYCVSGVFRQHFNRYLCCLCIKRQPRIRQHSTATGVMDTSIMSMRRSTVSNYNRTSLHLHNNANKSGSASGGGGGAGSMVTGSGNGGNGKSGGGGGAFNRQSSMQLHHSVAINNNGAGGGNEKR